MCWTLQNPSKLRIIVLSALTVWQISFTPAFCQDVSKSGYRYDTPQGNPYNDGNTNEPERPYLPYLPRSPYPGTTYLPPDSNSVTPTSTINPNGQIYSGTATNNKFVRLNPGELHEKTVWDAKSAQDAQLLSTIRNRQVTLGPADPATLRYMVDTAVYFAQEQKPNLAEPLLKEVIATILTFGVTPENHPILSLAQGRLAVLTLTDGRVTATPVIDPATLVVNHPYYATNSSVYVTGSGGGSSFSRGYGSSRYHSFHGNHVSFHSGHSSGHAFARCH